MNANQFAKGVMLSGMTFDPSIDCRNDLVNYYGYTKQQVSNMSDDELFAIMDRIEDAEKDYDDFESERIPEPFKDSKCKCGGKLNLQFIDCETRGDCSIYVFECVSCHKPTSFNYAEEWYEDEY